jgi:hypothetical protein
MTNEVHALLLWKCFLLTLPLMLLYHRFKLWRSWFYQCHCGSSQL